MVSVEMISCADGGPTPPPHLPDTSWYVGLYNDSGTIIGQFFADLDEASRAHRTLFGIAEDVSNYRDMRDS